MSKKETGGPAYPSRGGMMFYVPGEHKEAIQHTIEAMDREHEGMSLRDYFAAKALPGILTSVMSDECHNWLPVDFANESYKIADAMLAKRNQGE